MTRRRLLAFSFGAAGWSQEMPRAVKLLMRVSDGAIVSGNSSLASAWQLPPGSTIKPFIIQALLQAGRLKPSETFLCPGELRVGNYNMTCSHPRGLPPLDVARVIAYSCNCATARFAQRVRPEELATALRQYGFRVSASPDIRLIALGEEGILATPLSIGNAYGRLAKTCEPAVRDGLEGAVQFGTARAAAVSGLRVAGKTGTVITPEGLHAALFAGFAPSRAPEHVAVVVVQGSSGGGDAAPLAAELFRHRLDTQQRTASPESVYRVRFGGKVTSMGVEEYVAAVLAGEASVLQQSEALKAMAVAARTYAANQKGRHASEGFDFCNTTHYQRAEPGVVPENLIQGARATEGEMLRFRNSPVFTPYSMCCGGVTESGSAVWPDLIGVRHLRMQSDPYCQPDLWNRELALHDAEKALRAAGLSCPDKLSDISVADRTESGRARQLLLNGTQKISAGAFRFAIGRELGWNILRSTWFTISRNATQDKLEIRGRGEGHGVGLCQRGAESMASRGFGYRDILAFYYPNVSTTNWVRMGGRGIVLYGTQPSRERIVLVQAEQIAATQVPWPLSGTVEIYAHPTVEEFRNATREPGWVAAHSEGKRIDLQPVSVLQQKGLLPGTLHHELLHVAVESRAAPGLPVWFREGVVEWLAGNRRVVGTAAIPPGDESLRQRVNQHEAIAGYREAEAKVADLVAHYGETTVLGWVSRGLPDEVKNAMARSPATNRR